MSYRERLVLARNDYTASNIKRDPICCAKREKKRKRRRKRKKKNEIEIFKLIEIN